MTAHVRIEAPDRRLGGLRALAEKATPGPWRTGEPPATGDGIWSESAITGEDDEGTSSLVAWCHSDWRADEDAALIAAAVNALPALLDVVDAARELVGWDFRSSSADPREQAVIAALDRLANR